MTYEDEVKRHASHKNKLKHVDLRLCRLCYKTKFADGIGKACTECNKRVCNRCGAFSKATWNAKKQKVLLYICFMSLHFWYLVYHAVYKFV